MIECSIVGLTSLPLILAAEAVPSHRLEGAASPSRGPIRQSLTVGASPATDKGAAWKRDSIAGATSQDQTDHMSEPHPGEPPPRASAIDQVDENQRAAARPTVDDMSEWSFPASDPPATWTWDLERPLRG
jgi:hypothetical protein